MALPNPRQFKYKAFMVERGHDMAHLLGLSNPEPACPSAATLSPSPALLPNLPLAPKPPFMFFVDLLLAENALDAFQVCFPIDQTAFWRGISNKLSSSAQPPTLSFFTARPRGTSSSHSFLLPRTGSVGSLHIPNPLSMLSLFMGRITLFPFVSLSPS